MTKKAQKQISAMDFRHMKAAMKESKDSKAAQKAKMAPTDGMIYLYINLLIALLIRIGFIVYGTWQDSNMKVKFTDIDYKVFTDAAEYVAKGESPFRRATYRYTPLIAWLLTPNITVHVLFGKVVFVCMDLVGGYLLYKICRNIGYNQNTSLFCCQVAMFNPLPLAVSSRGNAESIMTVLTLGTIFCLTHRKWLYVMLGAILYGLAVHVKIYPVIYSIPIYLYLNEHFSDSHAGFRVFGLDVVPNLQRLLFILVSVSVCLGLTAWCYYLYGYEFLYETYLYHIVRKDIKHNFSPYFYLLYLIKDTDIIAPYIGLVTFIPQALFVLGFAYKFHSDLPFCFFMQTFMFVSFNKVCTSQYFLWYLAFFPIIIPRVKVSWYKGFLMGVLWFFGQAAWLLPAYYLEFQGQNTFFEIWLASLGFLSINVWIAYEILTNYQYRPLYRRGQKVGNIGRELYSIGGVFNLLLFGKSKSE